MKEITLKQLKELAKERNLKGRSKMNKEELYNALFITGSQVEKVVLSTAEKAKQLLQKKQKQAQEKASRKVKGFMSLDLQYFASKKGNVDALTEGLNEPQKDAVLSIDGTVQICSVAGSGKTRVLTHRIANMINNEGISPSKIMVTTFTKKASEEMIERLGKLITVEQLEELTIGTTHSIGYRILKEELRNTDFKQQKAFTKGRDGILQGWKQTKMFKEIGDKLKKKYEKVYESELQDMIASLHIPTYSRAISYFVNNNISPQEALSKPNLSAREGLYKEFYELYVQEKEAQGVIDFDDMLYLTVRLFSQYENILKRYQRKFEYILVDEAQDNNLLQYSLIKMLGYPNFNVFLVGDDDQSMYKFRGASPQSFIDFDKEYIDVKQIFLPYNYRSNSDILDKANKLILFNENRISKQLIPHKVTEEKSVYYERFEDEDMEAQSIVREIEALHADGLNYKDIAMLYRTNAQSRALEDKLILTGIPYILHGGVSFYDRAEIKDLIAYFQLAHDTKNNTAFKRIYNKPNRYLGNAFIDKLESVNHRHLYNAMSTMTFGRWSNGCREIESIVRKINDNQQKKLPLEDSLQYILKNCGYQEWLVGEDFDADADGNKLENIDTLRHLLSMFDSVESFVEHVDKVTNSKRVSDNAVHLMTIHKSKGLEFNTVFFVGVSEGLIPHARCLDVEFGHDDKNNPIEEERRLAYVAVTRAEKKCYVSSIDSYNGKNFMPSRFIENMELKTEEEQAMESGKVIKLKKQA